MNVEFRVVGPNDEVSLAEIFREIDRMYFRPHAFSAAVARRIARYHGHDAYALLFVDGRPMAYGMLRGFGEGYPTPSLGIAVRTSVHGRGLGRLMMGHLHEEARRRGARRVRLRVHPDNVVARHLYESLGYAYAGEDRGELAMLLDVEVPTAGPQAMVQGKSELTAELLGVDSPRWLAFLRGVDHDFYHLPAYAALCALHEGGTPQALIVEDGIRGMLLPLIVRLVPGGRSDASSPYGYPGPLLRGTEDQAFLNEAFRAGIRTLRAAGVVTAFVRLHPILNVQPPDVGTVVQHGETVSVDLSKPDEVIWAEMRENHRRGILRARRLGYVARIDESWEHFEAFKHLYRATMARHSASPYYDFDDRYFEDLRAALGERLHLNVVLMDRTVASAGLFVQTCGIVQYHLVGSDETFAKDQPGKLLIDTCIRWAQARGHRLLHLGGGVGGDEDSLMHFKAGFSPLRHPFRTLRVIVDEPEYRRLVATSDHTDDLGDLAGFFPPYRRA